MYQEPGSAVGPEMKLGFILRTSTKRSGHNADLRDANGWEPFEGDKVSSAVKVTSDYCLPPALHAPSPPPGTSR